MRKKSSFIHFVFLAIVIASLFVSCKQKNTDYKIDAIIPKKITIYEDKFVDNQGRQVILNGINVINKLKDEGYLVSKDSTLYTKLRNWGFNSIRFGVFWDRLETEPGVYNEKYLQDIDKHIQWAAKNDIFIVIDMHQDLYSTLYANGAPLWATINEGKPHRMGDIWSDAYLLSEAVQTSFDNFWANTLASDGVGLQDHYANMWQHIAKRYANNPTVIGYDLMNEPFSGSDALQSIPTLLEAYGKMLFDTTGKELSRKELELIWSSVDDRTKALQNLSSEKNFAAVIDALFPLNRDFETQKLQPFYQKVSDAIREVDTSSILFLEHSYLSNMGIRSSIARTTLVDGTHDSLLAYAPHGYDLVTDTKNAADASPIRLSFIYNRFQETAQKLNIPAWLGEWGAFYRHGEDIVPVAQHAVAQIETHLFGNAYWSYESKIDNLAYFNKALLRPYPAYTNGDLLEYRYNRENKTFSMTWKEDKNNGSPTMVFIPSIAKDAVKSIDKSFNAKIEPISNSSAGWLVITPLENGEKRRIEVKFKE